MSVVERKRHQLLSVVSDHALQFAVAENFVADKFDRFNSGQRPFVDFEHQVHSVLLERDDFWLDGRGEAAAPAIDIKNALYIALHTRLREHDARAQLKLRSADPRPSMRRFPSKAIRLMMGFSTTLTTSVFPSRRIATSLNRPVAKSFFSPVSIRSGSTNVSRPDCKVGQHGFILDALRSLDFSIASYGSAPDHRRLVLSNGNATC